MGSAMADRPGRGTDERQNLGPGPSAAAADRTREHPGRRSPLDRSDEVESNNVRLSYSPAGRCDQRPPMMLRSFLDAPQLARRDDALNKPSDSDR